MKIEANVALSDSKSEDYGQTYVKVSVDTDYVEGNHESIIDWVCNELEEMFGGAFCEDDFEVTNIDDIIEDIAFDEFEDKTTSY